MSQLVTRCPHCSTSFHVSEQQLRAARGAVRCGSCLQVFRADENIVFNEDDPQPATKKAIDELLDDDDFLIHDDIDLDGDEAQDEDDDLPRAKRASASKPASEQPPRKPEQQPLIDDAFGELQWQELESPTESDDLELGEDLEAARDDLWAEEIAMEAPLETPSSSPFSSEPPEITPPESLQDDWSAGVRRDDHDRLSSGMGDNDDLLPLPPSPSAKAAEEATGDDHIDALQRNQAPLLPRDQLISAIGPAPIEVNWQPKRHNRIPGWLWGLSALMLLIALAAQIAFFRFDTLSKRQPWRQMYAVACPMVGCTLPAQVDVRAIHTSNLVVRSHPQTNGALAVEAVLLNTAPFEQPFPDLLLRFTDLKNAPVASRRFKPADYLKGELAGRRLMPRGNPVHIALDIVDPGTEAVNYELEIAPR
ncbi:DUF3426 domain-containing protein [Microbulbifer sp. SA54]|uniref:DUF3426 domain-containing protein n=1 Tax=Microbulbifer sp. SA54 TaxID=3401577 RepID=UPI003AAE712E